MDRDPAHAGRSRGDRTAERGPQTHPGTRVHARRGAWCAGVRGLGKTEERRSDQANPCGGIGVATAGKSGVALIICRKSARLEF
jgi:hypothetical protein